MSTINLSQVLDNLRTVLDCPEPMLEAASPDLTERLRQFSHVAEWNQPGPSPQFPPDFADWLEPEIRSYRWDWTGVTSFAPDVIEPGLMEPTKPDGEAWGPTSSIPISKFGSLAPSLITQLTLSQVTRDLNRLVDEGTLSPTLREFILTGRPMEGYDPCQKVGTGKRPGQLPSNLPRLNSNVYTYPIAPFGGAELSARLNTLLPELQKLTSATQAQVRFSNYTGLPRTFARQPD